MWSLAGFVLDEDLSRVVFLSGIIFIVHESFGFCLMKHRKGTTKILLNSINDYADDLSILDGSMSKINELLEALRVQGARIGLKINVKKAMNK